MGKQEQRFKAINITYIAMFSALMAIGANVTSFITVGTVPLTLQTFFSILAGALLGSRLGSLSMIVYTLIGLMGAPVFAQFQGGFSIITKPTFGFILSFIILAYVAGKIIEKKNKPTPQTFFAACFVGLAINYLIGTNYLYFSLRYVLGLAETTYSGTWEVMSFFLLKDLVTTFLAALIAPRIYYAVKPNEHTSIQKSIA